MGLKVRVYGVKGESLWGKGESLWGNPLLLIRERVSLKVRVYGEPPKILLIANDETVKM